MSGVTLSISLGGERRVLDALDGIAARLADKAPLMRDISQLVLTSTQHRFETQTGPDGLRWQPSVRALATGGVTLTDTGRLKDSFIAASTADTAEVGSNVVYAPPHQFGRSGIEEVAGHTRLIREAFGKPLRAGVYQTVRPHSRKLNLPARPMLGLSEDDRGDILDLAEQHIAGDLA
ncbi:MAG: phage virion morphogenesis protein [Caulobacter sp.]|nr:phage virion morphogenesis protein [Caulobacter sp.]